MHSNRIVTNSAASEVSSSQLPTTDEFDYNKKMSWHSETFGQVRGPADGERTVAQLILCIFSRRREMGKINVQNESATETPDVQRFREHRNVQDEGDRRPFMCYTSRGVHRSKCCEPKQFGFVKV